MAAVEMGYGHLRAAYALAQAIGDEVALVDRPPWCGRTETALRRTSRRLYEQLSRATQLPALGAAARWLLDRITAIPAELQEDGGDGEPGVLGIALHSAVRRGLGRRLAIRLGAGDRPLLTTFFTPAIACDHFGAAATWCVVTDADVSRAWAPHQPAHSRIRYLTPSSWAARRLRSYGVSPERIRFTGFPLPEPLLGGVELPTLRRNLSERLVRLDPAGTFRHRYRHELVPRLGELPRGRGEPPLVTYAVGGAGAQASVVRTLLPGLEGALRRGRFRLCLVAGTRRRLAERFRGWLDRHGFHPDAPYAPVEILVEDDLRRYLDRFNDLLARTDVLWTKPSEMTFYAALGLPLVLSPPLGVHEGQNRRWAVEAGAGLQLVQVARAQQWLSRWLDDSTLALAAWRGFLNLPKRGLYRILDATGALRADRRRDLPPAPHAG